MLTMAGLASPWGQEDTTDAPVLHGKAYTLLDKIHHRNFTNVRKTFDGTSTRCVGSSRGENFIEDYKI